jgi:DNA-binding CsgD family transcriptional regulator
VDGFREAALRPELWPSALDRLAQVFRSDGTTLVLGKTTRKSIIVSSACAPFVDGYFDTLAYNPREQRVKAQLHESFKPDAAYFSRHEIARDPYYQEYLAPRGFGWNAVAALRSDLLISVKRGFRHAPYEGADLKALDDALPCLRSASATAVAVWQSGFTGQLSAFERIGRGALLIDSKARILAANALVHFGDGFDTVGGILQATRMADRPVLQNFLKDLMLPGGAGSSAAARSITVSRPSGRRPWLFEGIACASALRSLHSHAAALLLVTDMAGSARCSQQNLSALFELTPTESSLARELASGGSLRDVAARLGISEGHARQRLQRVFQKTGTSRQGELVALLARIP